MRATMYALAIVSPGVAVRPVTEVPRPLGPRADAISTVAILLIGLVLIVGAVRAVCKH
jgi:hypothetical protein